MSRAQKFLAAMALVPAVGLFVVTVAPPPRHGYPAEQAFLLVLALVALGLSKAAPGVAVLFYSALALVPVGSMLEYYQSIGGTWWVLELAPILGILFVAVLLRDGRATLLYGVIAIAASGVFCGRICNDWGQAGAMAFFSGGLTAALHAWLGCTTQQAISLLHEVRGEQKTILKNQQELASDT